MADISFSSIRSAFSLDSMEPDFSLMYLSERSLKENPQPSPPEPDFETITGFLSGQSRASQAAFYAPSNEA